MGKYVLLGVTNLVTIGVSFLLAGWAAFMLAFVSAPSGIGNAGTSTPGPTVSYFDLFDPLRIINYGLPLIIAISWYLLVRRNNFSWTMYVAILGPMLVWLPLVLWIINPHF